MKKVVYALVVLAFIGFNNVVSADDLMRFRLNGNSIYDQPYGDRNEFPCPDRLGSCTMTDEDYRSTRKGQSLEVFDTAYEAKQHLNFKPQLPSGLGGLRPVHVSIVDHDVLQVVYAYHELLKGTYFDRVDDMPNYFNCWIRKIKRITPYANNIPAMIYNAIAHPVAQNGGKIVICKLVISLLQIRSLFIAFTLKV